MLNFIYNFFIAVYGFIILIASLFSVKAAKWVSGRKNWKHDLLEHNFRTDNWVWFHCSSYGEFQDGRTVIEKFRNEFPSYKIILTFFSPSGYEAVKNTFKIADKIYYLPPDTIQNAGFFVKTIHPKAVFFIRNDIWYNYLCAIEKLKTPVFLISFALDEKSSFARFPQRILYKKAFQKFNIIFVQDKDSKAFLEKFSFSTNVIITGNTRVDNVKAIAGKHLPLDDIKKFVGSDLCVIAGSALQKDKTIFIKTFLRLQHLDIKWIIAPHEINNHEIEMSKKITGKQIIRYSELNRYQGKEKILWIDNVGMLSNIYRYTDIAFIGGGFNKIGIHNILEPAAFGNFVCFGPNTRDYKEARELIDLKGATIVGDSKELKTVVLQYLSQKNNQGLKSVISNYVTENSGATEKVINVLKEGNYLS